MNRNNLETRPEKKSFIKTALDWNGSVTPFIMPRLAVAAIYSAGIYLLEHTYTFLSISIEPFEYSGAVLGLLLILRVNSGVDRWWEARKLWGTIVNQSRNLAIAGFGYSKVKNEVTDEFLKWVAIWPHVMKESLRGRNNVLRVSELLGNSAAEKVLQSQHMPTYVGYKLTQLLIQMKSLGLDSFAFLRAETERSGMIDAIGACERIRSTRMPLALAIITRRFILLFLALLPFGLAEGLGWLTPVVVVLVAYPLLALDEIGAELQNPFSDKNLSHLPLDQICSTIEKNVLSLKNYEKFEDEFEILPSSLSSLKELKI